MAKNKKRVDLRKNRSKPARDKGWTAAFSSTATAEEATVGGERVRAKGDLSRKRTIETTTTARAGDARRRSDALLAGPCGLLLWARQSRADRRWPAFSLQGAARAQEHLDRRAQHRRHGRPRLDSARCPNDEGVIERVEPRHGILTRASRGREHVLVANVDQVVIVIALKEPDLKQHLIDRYLASAAQGGIKPIICLNKADLIDPAEVAADRRLLQPARHHDAADQRPHRAGDRALAQAAQGSAKRHLRASGVGKSSLLNAIQPELGLRVARSQRRQSKGPAHHDDGGADSAQFGGWVVDTPGIRQFALWDIIPEEVEGFFAEFRPYVPLCGFPDCTHTHEERCAVKNAVALRYLSEQRYFSYLGMREGDGEKPNGE